MMNVQTETTEKSPLAQWNESEICAKATTRFLMLISANRRLGFQRRSLCFY
jgi:hypothetical protein